MRVIETFNLVFHKELEVPSHQTILDWIVKSGIAESHNISRTSLKDGEAYHIITDNSVCVNGQELHLELISPAKHPGHAIMHSDVRVAKMKVGKNWWKSRACLTPEGEVALPPENDFILTP